MINYLGKIRKALSAGVGAGLGTYLSAMADGHVTIAEWEMVVGTAIVTGVVTWFIPNEKSNASNTGNTGVTKP